MLLVTMPTREADGKLVCTSNGSASFLKIPRISPAYPPTTPLILYRQLISPS